jgi:hypothetical protein
MEYLVTSSPLIKPGFHLFDSFSLDIIWFFPFLPINPLENLINSPSSSVSFSFRE